MKAEWHGVPEVFDRPDIIEERHRIDVDCRRTDRTQPLFMAPSVTSEDQRALRRRSTFSPNLNDHGSQAPSNDHIDRLAGILLTYNFYEKQLGDLKRHG